MIDSTIIARLEGLHTALLGELKDPRHQNYGGARIIALFKRYETIRSELAINHPQLFSEFIQIPGPENSDVTVYRGQIERLLAEVESVRTVIQTFSEARSPTPAVTREGIFFAGQTFDALRSVQSLIEVATAKIWLVDNYLDSSVLDLFTVKSNRVLVKILTKDAPASFMIACQRFNQQYGRLEVRTANPFHDRFLVIDDRDFYHFGASIKDLGKRGFMFSRIEEPSIIKELTTELTRAWNSSKVAI